ncbi:hypothetical protein FRC17_006859, partial [Serendipita sp. 399]
MPVTRLSSPTSSVRHAFSNVSAGTSAGRSSVSRDGSAAALSLTNVNGLSAEELEVRGEALASRIWEEDETFKTRERFSEWLGQLDNLNAIARRHYMDHFDFTNLRVDTAFRKLCGKLFIRGESQVIDRILIEFSRRYWEHNPTCVFGNASNVHQVVYSLLLLNTDLHIADLPQHMTKQQFVTNTMGTLVAPSRTSSTAVTPARSSSPAPILEGEHPRKGSGETSSPSLVDRSAPSSMQNPTLRMHRSGSVTSGKGSLSREPTRETSLSAHSSVRQLSGGSVQYGSSGAATESPSMNGSTVSVPDAGRKHPSAQGSVTSLPIVSNKAWEADVESMLKDIYSAIRSSQILQPTSNNSLSPGAGPGRTGSIRRPSGAMGKFKRTSIMQSLVTQGGANGSSGSFDGRISPSPSSNASLTDAYASAQQLFVHQTLGFASNLTNTIIKEAQEDDSRSLHSIASNSSDVSITDEELALLGAPWAKEGMLTRKQYMESTGKRAKHRNWMDVFVVIQKGQVNMFTFGGANSSTRTIGKPGQRGVVGGGNWLDNATNVGEFMLAHSLSHALPQNHDNRRYCFVLTLATGMTFFFQAGTEELVNEWVSTCNYWAARQSKEPLAGGVSNMEYGWSRVEDVRSSTSQDDLNASRPSIRDNTDNFSLMSGRSRMGRFGDGFSSLRASPMADRIYINDWRAPGHSMVASTHDEETQLESLQRYSEKL